MNVLSNLSRYTKSQWQGFWQDSKGTAKLAPLFASRLFWTVFVFKIICSFLFASDYLLKLFVPFLDYFVSHPFDDPYQHFWQIGNTRAFPYPAMMLDIMAIPFLIVKLVASHIVLPSSLSVGLARLPLLGADTLIMAILARWLRTRLKQAILYYWCSPVLFYITYIHGQLDVVPLALLFLSIYLLFSERLLWAAIFLGFALSAKTHLAIVAPFFLLFIYRHELRVRAVLYYGAIVAAAFLLPNIFYVGHAGFFHMVFENPEQQKLMLAAVSFAGASIAFYVIPAVYLFLLFGASSIAMQSRDLFLMFLGFSFGVIIFFITPMQGWYYWIIPFFAYFFTRASEKIALFALLQISYFAFFAVNPLSDYFQVGQILNPYLALTPNLYSRLSAMGLSADIIVNAAFTLMQTSLFLNCLWIYRTGVKGLQNRKLISHPFLLGIGGNSGSGKTTIAQDLQDIFAGHATILCGDDVHKWQRGHEKWNEMTHLDPRANELHHEIQSLHNLKRRRAIQRRHYDHETGQFTDAQTVRSASLVIYEGLHSFYLESASQLFDLKVFMDPQYELWLQRKIARDMEGRNHSREKILSVLEQRAGDAEKYIVNQQKMADVIISFRLKEGTSAADALPSDANIFLRMSFANRFYLEPLIEGLLIKLDGGVTHIYDADGWQVIDIYKTVAPDILDWLGEKHISGLHDIGVYDPQWKEGWNGIVQLFLTYCIFYEADHHENR